MFAAKLTPIICIAAFILIGRMTGFQSHAMRAGVLIILGADILALFFLNRKDQASPIHKGLGLFILLAAISIWLWPDGAGRLLGKAPAAGVYLVLFLVAAVPPVLGRDPFTMYFARKTTPRAVWHTDVFLKINHHLTWFWAALFFVCILLGLAPAAMGLCAPLALVCFEGLFPLALMLGLGLPMTRKYPGHYQRKLGLRPLSPKKETPLDRPGHERPSPTGEHPGRAMKKEEEQKMATSATIVAVNGSPHRGMGNTSMMIEMLRRPLSGEGFDLEVIHLAQHHIEYCRGCGFCLERGQCWIKDDHRGILDRLLGADGIVLGSPVYVMHVTAQMKTFLDRSLGLGHKPRPAWKPGLAVCVSAGLGEVETGRYLAGVLRPFGAFAVGTLTAMAAVPGEFIGKEAIEARAADLARDLARAVREKRRYPATEHDLRFYHFMGDLVKRHKDSMMKDDFAHWEKHGLFEGFETYIQQKRTRVPFDDTARQAWIKKMIAEHRGKRPPAKETPSDSVSPKTGPGFPKTCRELLQMMPMGFKADAAGDLNAVYQFEVSGKEDFVGHLKIAEGTCTYQDGPAEDPDVIIRTPADVWLAIATGDLDGQEAFMAGKYTVEGDLGLMLKLKSLFSRR